MEIVRRRWDQEVHGCAMFRVVKRLKEVKGDLKKLNQKGYSDIHVVEAIAYQHLLEAQGTLHGCPGIQVYSC